MKLCAEFAEFGRVLGVRYVGRNYMVRKGGKVFGCFYFFCVMVVLVFWSWVFIF